MNNIKVMYKSVVTLMAIILLGWPALAQNVKAQDDDILRIFNKYEDKEGVESIVISPSLLELMQNSKSDQKTKDLISKISGLRIITINDKPGTTGNPLREQLLNELQPILSSGYDQILKVKSDGERVELYVKKTSENVTSALLFITSDVKSVTAMHLSGRIDKMLIDAVMNGEIGTSSSK